MLHESAPKTTSNAGDTEILIVACGALAKEILYLTKINQWHRFRLHCIPAKYHLFPNQIVTQVARAVKKERRGNQPVFIGFADCGTGDELNTYVEENGFHRLPGAHCYQFFAGYAEFNALQEAELGTFYLTDFLARHFQSLIVKGFKLDSNPELIPMMFGNYRKVVYLAQTRDSTIEQYAMEAADFLGLQYEKVFTGYGLLEKGLQSAHSERTTNHT